MSKEFLIACQPNPLLSFFRLHSKFELINLESIKIEPESLNITLVNGDKRLDIIYDCISNGFIMHPAWSFRFGKILSRMDLRNMREDLANVKNKDAFYYYKVINSEYIKWHDENSPFKSVEFSRLEHHLFITADEVFDILSLDEPKLILTDRD